MTMGSLTNKRNTRIEEITVPTGERSFKAVAWKLYHHGSNTCTIVRQDNGAWQVVVDLCGWDTVTTRGKINAFLRRYLPFVASLQRVKGETLLAHYAKGTGTMMTMPSRGQVTFTRN